MRLEGKRIAVLAEDNFEDLELWYPLIRMREEGADVSVVGMRGVETYHGKHGLPVEVDVAAQDVSGDEFDAVIIPGGYAPDRMRRHKAMLDLVRRVDIVVILLDITTDPIGQYEEIMRILEEYRIFPEGTEVPENIRRPVFMKKISVVVNKVDGPGREEDFQAFLELAELKVPALPVSILNGTNLDVFLRIIYDMSGIIRVYSKNPGREPDMDEPFVIPRDSTLEDLAGRIHKDFLTKLKYARIWGRTVHDGMMVQRDYVMQDGDIVEIHL